MLNESRDGEGSSLIRSMRFTHQSIQKRVIIFGHRNEKLQEQSDGFAVQIVQGNLCNESNLNTAQIP